MNFLENTLNNLVNKTNHEVLEDKKYVDTFDINDIEEELENLSQNIESGLEYQNNKLVKDNHISDLETKIKNADDSADVTVLHDQLDYFYNQRDNADLIKEKQQQAEYLKEQIKQWTIDNVVIQN